ncbi:MAG TPA: hypothetical protein VG944_16865 [Fimbriimonas sp.]|nr:hypothetical protein [Fimbriimonas sp.]
MSDRARSAILLAMLAAFAVEVAGCGKADPPPAQATPPPSLPSNMKFGYHPPTK